MKKVTIFLMVALLVALSTGFAQTTEITADVSSGGAGPGELYTGRNIGISIRYTATVNCRIAPLSNAWKLTSPDGATWSNFEIKEHSTCMSYGFDQLFTWPDWETPEDYYDGESPDYCGFEVPAGFGCGWVTGPGFAQPCDNYCSTAEPVTISFYIDPSQAGKTLVLDSAHFSWFPWIWETLACDPAQGDIYPGWGGPYTFTLLGVAGSDVPGDYATIQEAIDNSVDGDTIIVSPGTYKENINFNGHNVLLASLYLVNHDTSYISSTIIDGTNSGSVVTFENGETFTAQLCGFTIYHGQADKGGGIYISEATPKIRRNIIKNNATNYGSDVNGGGMYIENAMPFIDSNYFIANSSDEFGGAIGLYQSNVLVRFNTIEGCRSDYGAGIYCAESPAQIYGNKFLTNQAHYDGGGIFCLQSTPDIIYNRFEENSAGGWSYGGNDITPGSGGGICCDESDANIDANTFYNNTATQGTGIGGRGGAIYCHNSNTDISFNLLEANRSQYGAALYIDDSGPDVFNNTIINNSLLPGDGAEMCGGIYSSSTYNSYNNILWNNEDSEIYVNAGTPNINYSDIDEGWPSGTGNISLDPIFCAPSVGNYNLSSSSPCSGTGSAGLDMGAFEATCNCCEGVRGNADCSESESPDISDIVRIIDFLYLSKNPLCCTDEADCNGSGGNPDVSDIVRLIDFLYLSHDPMASCP